jgi:large subunit ribosomal protein L14e
MKLAGRDAGEKCVIVDVVDKYTVIIDGETRRRKCNLKHLEPLGQKLDVSKGASTSEVQKALGYSAPNKKGKSDKKQAPKKKRTKKQKPVKTTSTDKSKPKKEEKKE